MDQVQSVSEVLVYPLTQYGRTRFLPLNDTGKYFLELLNQKSFTKQNLISIGTLGHSVKILEPGQTVPTTFEP